jgi:hypothetical protein
MSRAKPVLSVGLGRARRGELDDEFMNKYDPFKQY